MSPGPCMLCHRGGESTHVGSGCSIQCSSGRQGGPLRVCDATLEGGLWMHVATGRGNHPCITCPGGESSMHHMAWGTPVLPWCGSWTWSSCWCTPQGICLQATQKLDSPVQVMHFAKRSWKHAQEISRQSKLSVLPMVQLFGDGRWKIKLAQSEQQLHFTPSCYILYMIKLYLEKEGPARYILA